MRRRDPASRIPGSVGAVVPGSRAAVVTDQGITVYPARCEGDRWRAVWYEPGAASVSRLICATLTGTMHSEHPCEHIFDKRE